MRVELLGPARIDGQVDALTPRDRVVLTALTVHRDGPVSVDVLAQALWADEQPASRVKVVQGCISRLRKRLGPEAIITEAGGYRLVLDDEEVDVHRFEQLVDRGRELLALDEPDPAAHALGEALALWSDRILGDLDDWDEGRVERQRLLSLRTSAEEWHLTALLEAGRAREALPQARRLVEAEPLRESRRLLLARAQYQCGRQAEALDTLATTDAVLARELGLDTGPAVDALRQQILRHDESLTVGVTPAECSRRCPYPGLLPFEADAADDFFGRDAAIEQCMARLGQEGVLVVVGPSGSGKSSLVRAGLAARCRREGRSVRVLVPGHDLEWDLDFGRSRPDVVIVDQLEVLLTPDVSAAERGAALEAIAEEAGRGWLVLVLRSDRLGQVASGPVAGLVERGLLLLGPMQGDALRQAIEEPAERAGLLLEPGLVDLLVREVEDEPGALPLLAHALRATWQRREGRTLTVHGYHAAGGVRGAVAQTAEAVHGQLDQTGRRWLRDLLLRMVVPSADGTAVAMPMSMAVAADSTASEVLERLVAARLVTIHGDHTHLAHEALIRAWPRLRSWLEDDVAGQQLLRHLSLAAVAWDALGRPDSELYRGVRLHDALAWRDRSDSHLAPLEHAFLDAGEAHRDDQLETHKTRLDRAMRTNRWMRRLVRGITLLALVAVVASGIAAVAATRANDAALAADARRVGAHALVSSRLDTSLLLAVAAVQLDDSPDTRASLLTALGRSPKLAHVLVPADGGALTSIAVSPDGRLIAVDEETVGLRFLDGQSGAERVLVQDGDGPMGVIDATPAQVAFHPDGGPIAHVASSGDRRAGVPVLLRDPATLEVVGRPTVDLERTPLMMVPTGMSWSPDGRSLAAVVQWHDDESYQHDGALLAVWDVGPSGATDGRTVRIPLQSRSVVWTPDGQRLLTATARAPVEDRSTPPRTTVWDVTTLTPTAALEDLGHPIALSPDGATLAGLAVDGDGPPRVRLIDAAFGVERFELTGDDGGVQALAFSPDGTTVATAGGRTVVTWDARTGRRVESFSGHHGDVTGVAFRPDGRTLLTVGADGAGLAWDLTGARSLLQLVARPDRSVELHSLALLPVHASISPDGDTVALVGATVRQPFGDVHAGVQVLDVTAERLSTVRAAGHHPWQVVMWREEGDPMTLDPIGQLSTWDRRTGDLVEHRWLGITGSLVDLGEDQGVLLSETPPAIVRFDPRIAFSTQGLLAPPTLLATVPGAAELQFSQFSMRPVAVSTASDALAAFAGRSAAMADDAPRVTTPMLFDTLPPSDHLVVIDSALPEASRVVDLGFDGAAAAFDADGRRIAVAGRLGVVAVIERSSGLFLGRPTVGHAGAGRSVAWTADGRIVATGGSDGRVALWDGDSGASLGSVAVSDPGTIPYVASGRNGTINIATTDGEVFSIDTRLASWIDTACAMAARPLTAEEWVPVAGDRPMPDVCPQS